MRKLYIIAFVILSFNVFGDEAVEKFKAQLKTQYKLLDNEIRIVKLKDFMKSSIRNDDDQKRIMKSVAGMRQTKKEMDDKGYVSKENQMINALLNEIKDPIIRHSVKNRSSEFSDTLAGFKVGYDYKIINPSFYDKHWGYSPMGGYAQCYEGECQEGWSGVMEFFDKEDLTCKYSEHNTKAAHGGNELVEELITYSINNKPTIELVTKDKPGFMYRVEWFQKDYDRTLECASKIYSKELFDKVKSYAVEIDNGF